ncbi:hypothetical protein F66182_15916, partial [Fusarium sp. NRRL 66182]
MDVKDTEAVHIDDVEGFDKILDPVVGSTRLINEFEVVLVPTPSNDPNDPLNLPVWQKYLILLIVGTYAATGNLMTSGMSAFLQTVEASYNYDPKVSDLVTWPAFFMGVGNLLSIPLSYAVGRRPIYLLSTILLAFGCLWCAKSKSLGSHIAGRDVMSIAAGTAEALYPVIVQEIFYLHERGKVVAAYSALQTLGTAALIIASPYIASNPSLGWRWWYGIFGCVSGLVTVLSFIFVKETKYDRPLEALNGEGILQPIIHYFLADMAPWSGTPQWSRAIACCKEMSEVFFFPNVLWLILLSDCYCGRCPNSVRLVQRFDDEMVEPKPEYRLLALIIPTVAILISTIIYGKTAQNPEDWTWAGIAVTLNFEYFGFVGIVVSSFVYCMDAYPQRVGAALVLICSCRGFIGFGISYGAISFVDKAGYEGGFNICAGIV